MKSWIGLSYLVGITYTLPYTHSYCTSTTDKTISHSTQQQYYEKKTVVIIHAQLMQNKLQKNKT